MKNSNSPCLDAALGYAARGWLVNPIKPGTKACDFEGVSIEEHASTDTTLIDKWWKENPRRNVGLVPGTRSGFVVVDLDVKGDAHGLDILQHLQRKTGLEVPRTRRERTWSGGEHLYFRHPGESPLGIRLDNVKGMEISPRFNGIEFFGSPSNIVAAPSVVNRKPYAVTDDSDLAPLPDELLRTWCWLLEQKALSPKDRIPNGQRDETIFMEAVRLHRLYGDDGRERALAELLRMNEEQCDKPLKRRQVEKCLRSAWRYPVKARRRPSRSMPIEELGTLTTDDFYAYMPMAGQFIFVPNRELWPAGSVDARLPPVIASDGTPVLPSAWLKSQRAVEQMTWAPGEPMVIENRLITANGGWIEREGCSTFNQYLPPQITPGDATKAGPWIDHVHRVYPEDAEHIIHYLAFKRQQPGVKINHALMLGGPPGIGKDSILEPVKYAVGPWNCHEVSPNHLMKSDFNPFVKSVILRISEARDLGEFDRYALYEHMKTLTTTPPDVTLCNEKHIRQYAVMNVCGVVITTNHLTDGIYLPADDRRHYVAWSNLEKESFEEDYFNKLYRWYESGGTAHVVAYLDSLDLSGFDPKAPPKKTEAFFAIVDANRSAEESEMADAVEALGAAISRKSGGRIAHDEKPKAITLATLMGAQMSSDFSMWLADRKNRRAIPHKLRQIGYVTVRNPDSPQDGLWRIAGKRQTIYAMKTLSVRDQITAAKELITELSGRSAEIDKLLSAHRAVGE